MKNKPDFVSECKTVVLFRGDCTAILPQMATDSVDITVTSPPYNMIPKTNPSGLMREYNFRKLKGYNSHADNLPEVEYVDLMRQFASQCLRICRGLVWINHKTRFSNKKGLHPLRIFPFDFHSEIIWFRPGSLTLNANRYAPNHEFIYGFGSPHFWDRRNDMNLTVWKLNPERKIDGHPCPFPVVIPERCIQSSCPSKGTVIDPFMGSGTTGVAAIRNGRRFIGIEKDPEYFRAAKKRICAALSAKEAATNEKGSS